MENCQSAVSKPDRLICCPHRIVESCGEGAGFVVTIVIINVYTGFKHSGRDIESKTSSVLLTCLWLKTVVWIRVIPRGTKDHWCDT